MHAVSGKERHSSLRNVLLDICQEAISCLLGRHG
jgi:hypothetical protein